MVTREYLYDLIQSKSKLYTAYSVKDKEGKFRSVVDVDSVVELLLDEYGKSYAAGWADGYNMWKDN